jgi:hypothetical protein
VLQKYEKQEEVKKVADSRLLYTYLLWKQADNEDGIVQSIYWLCKGWTSTRELTAKWTKIFLNSLRRSYEFPSSLNPPIKSVILSRLEVGIGQRSVKLLSQFQLVLILRMSGG